MHGLRRLQFLGTLSASRISSWIVLGPMPSFVTCAKAIPLVLQEVSRLRTPMSGVFVAPLSLVLQRLVTVHYFKGLLGYDIT